MNTKKITINVIALFILCASIFSLYLILAHGTGCTTCSRDLEQNNAIPLVDNGSGVHGAVSIHNDSSTRSAITFNVFTDHWLNGRELVDTFSTDAKGDFTIKLDPGVYILKPVINRSERIDNVGEYTIHVPRNAMKQVEITLYDEYKQHISTTGY